MDFRLFCIGLLRSPSEGFLYCIGGDGRLFLSSSEDEPLSLLAGPGLGKDRKAFLRFSSSDELSDELLSFPFSFS